MSDNIEEQLCMILKTTEFSLQLDESTLPDKKSLLLTYVRFVKDENLMEEFLFAKELETHTTGESVFQLVVGFFNEKEIPLTNIVSCATDGAPSMLSHHRGFIKYLKEAMPGVLTVHCVIHRQNLIAKNISGRLHHSLSTVIRAVNTIKARALSSRLFRQLCAESNEEFEQLLQHTEVRWLTKGNSLRRFYSLFSTVVKFFQALDDSAGLELISIKADIVYLSDIFMKFNEVNLQLQGNLVNLIKVKSTVLAFISKLELYKRNLGRHELFQFPSLAEVDKESTVLDDDLQEYCSHLDQLRKDMTSRFQDIFFLEVPDWVIDPQHESSLEGAAVLEEELISLRNDIELKPKLSNFYQDFWLQKAVRERYPAVWNKVKLYFIAFPTSYMVEKGFSAVSQVLCKQRNRLAVTDRGNLRLFLTALKLETDKLVSSHQAHPSH